MNVSFLPDRQTLDYRAQRVAGQACTIERRDRPVVWTRGRRSNRLTREQTKPACGHNLANTTSSNRQCEFLGRPDNLIPDVVKPVFVQKTLTLRTISFCSISYR